MPSVAYDTAIMSAATSNGRAVPSGSIPTIGAPEAEALRRHLPAPATFRGNYPHPPHLRPTPLPVGLLFDCVGKIMGVSDGGARPDEEAKMPMPSGFCREECA